MSKKMTKADLLNALNAAGVTVPASATLIQLRSLYDIEFGTNNGNDAIDDVDEAESDAVDLDEQLAMLEKKRKILALQKEVQELENDLAAGVQKLSITDVDNIVPKFSGDNAYSIEKWIIDFENAMQMCKGSAHFKYMSARRLLIGTAAIFLRSSSAKTYEELKNQLLAQFKRHVTSYDVHNELRKRRRFPNENIISYMLSMREIAAQAYLDDSEVINAIIEGLSDRSAHTSMLYTAKNYDDLQHLLLIYDKRRPVFNTAERKEIPTREPRCYNCSKGGHISSQCSQPKRVQGSCFICNASGHQIKDCPKKRSGVTVNAIDDQDDGQSIEHNQKVSVAFDIRNVNGRNFIECFSLIDSGSPVSFVCQNLLPFDLSEDVKILSPLCGIGGKRIETYGQIEGEILLKNELKILTFYIIPDNLISNPLLLGRDFFRLFNIQLCIQNNKLNKNHDKNLETNNLLNLVHIPKIYFNNAPKEFELGGLCNVPQLNCDDENCLTIDEIDKCLLTTNPSDIDCFVKGSTNKKNLIISEIENINCKVIDKIDNCLLTLNNDDTDCSANSFSDLCESKINNQSNSIEVNNRSNYNEQIVRDCSLQYDNTIFCSTDLNGISIVEYEIGENLQNVQKNEIKNIINKYYLEWPKRTTEKPIEMNIKLTSNQAVYAPPRRLSQVDKEKCQQIIDELLEKQIIRSSDSPYASPIVLVKKKCGETRMCVDYRELNKITIRDHYPLPLIEDCLDYMGGKKLFTLLDLKSGFHQVKMAQDSIKYTSFVTPVGQFEYLMMPFGLTNAPSVFQRFINIILKEFIIRSEIIVYMDDILIASKDFEEHVKTLKAVFITIAEYGLELKMSKCKFCYKSIDYLGHSIDSNGIKPNEQHKKHILKYPIPKNLKQLHAFIGLCAYFRKFIPQFSRIAKPLYDLLKKNVKFELSEECLNRIEILKQKLIDCPVLSIYEPSRETELHCDACAQGYGAVLMQKQNDEKFHPVFYYSKRTTAAEAKYHSFELETLAIIYALRRFRVYLEGIPFKIVTDCNSLTLTLNKKTLNPRIARWALELQNYNYVIQHRSGVNMGHVDALSRSEIVLTIDENEMEFQLYATQNRDPEIVKLRDILEKKPSDLFDLQNGIVFRKDKIGEMRFYVPSEMENNVIRLIHEKIGHLGITKTYDTLRANYWFPSMKTKVEAFIKNCLKCITYSAPARIDERNLFSIPKKPIPFDTLHIDHLGPLPSIKSKRKHLLVIVDAFTKFIKLYPVNSTSTKEVIESLKKYFNYYSRPGRIVSDRGSCFTSSEFSEFLLKNNINHVKVAVGSPQANGQVERANRVLTTMLSKLSEPIQHSDWYLKLCSAEFAINNTIHSSTGKTPSMLLFGTSQRGPEIDEFTEYFEELKTNCTRNIELIRNEASEAIVNSQQHNEKLFEKNHRPAKQFNVGDYVVIKNVDTRAGVNKKLIPKFKGPYVVDKTLPNDRYIIKDIENCQITQIPYNGVIESRFLRLWCEHKQPN